MCFWTRRARAFTIQGVRRKLRHSRTSRGWLTHSSGHNRLAACAAALLLAACSFLPITLDLSYVPGEPRPLQAVGIHALKYSIAVVDGRVQRGSLELCRRGGAFGGRVRASRDLRLVVANALAAELHNHDLSVVRVRDSDVVLDVVLVEWICGIRQIGERTELYNLIEGGVSVRDAATGRITLGDLPFEVMKRRRAGSVIPGSTYKEVIEEALGEFSRRVVRHPDVLIAAQAVAARRPDAESD